MIKVSVPGSMLLFGEHSVLRGAHAIVFAINKRIAVSIEPRLDRLIKINSSLGKVEVLLDDITVNQPFQYVLQALKQSPPSCGLNIDIVSEMSSVMGFGTSAAVVVATISGLEILAGNNLDKLFDKSLQVVRAVQGIGSGADIMASIHGGIGLFQNDCYSQLEMPLEMFAAYYGKKVPTPEVVRFVEEKFKKYPEVLKKIDKLNDALTIEASNCLYDQEKLGELLNISSGLMGSIGLHTKDIEKFLWNLREQSYGVKLSGSGLGDCAIGIAKDSFYPANSFAVCVDPKGVAIS